MLLVEFDLVEFDLAEFDLVEFDLAEFDLVEFDLVEFELVTSAAWPPMGPTLVSNPGFDALVQAVGCVDYCVVSVQAVHSVVAADSVAVAVQSVVVADSVAGDPCLSSAGFAYMGLAIVVVDRGC